MYDYTDDVEIDLLDNIDAWLDSCRILAEKLEEMNQRLNAEIDKTKDDPIYDNLRRETDSQVIRYAIRHYKEMQEQVDKLKKTKRTVV